MASEYRVDVESINTRRKAEEISRQARKNGHSTLDLSNVEFVSRSVADELIHQSEKHSLELAGLSGDVESMIEIVRERAKLTA